MRIQPSWRDVVTGLLLGFLSASLQAADIGADDPRTRPVEALISDLAHIQVPAPGLHPTASVGGFIGDDSATRFDGGVIGSQAPQVAPEMRELVRRGAVVVPEIVQHLTDDRATGLTVGAGRFFMFRLFEDAYDPRTMAAAGQPRRGPISEMAFEGPYRVKVGDVCYAILGQIVNRRLIPVRYQPTGGLVVNSPVQTPRIATLATQDWAGLDAKGHRDSLVADASSVTPPFVAEGALVRLRFYYPEEYQRLRTGALAQQIAAFEADEARRAKAADDAHRQ